MGLALTDLIRRIGGDEAVEIQSLQDDLHGARALKGGVTELRFGTRQITPTEIMNGTNRKVGMILWLDKAAVEAALKAWRAERPVAEGSAKR